MNQSGLFGLSDRLKRLSANGDPLEELVRIVDFEGFRPILDNALAYSDGAKGGRPPYDCVAMFKILIRRLRTMRFSEPALIWAAIASLIECCKLNGINPNTYLTDVLTRIAVKPDGELIGELLPGYWLNTINDGDMFEYTNNAMAA